MASVNGVLSPPPLSESANSPSSLLAKRKRDDTIEVENIPNGTAESEGAGLPAESAEDSRTLIRDLVDVLKV